MIYYFDFFAFRLMLSILVTVKNMKTIHLFSIIFIWQFIFMHVKLFKVYE